MKPKYQLTILFFTLICMNLCAQVQKLEKVLDDPHNIGAEYIDAIKIYEKVIEDGQLEDPELFIKIASAYYFNSDYTSAIKWFKKYYNIYNIKPLPIHNYWYGQSLKAQKEYKKADSLLAPYYQSKGERYEYASNLLNFIDTTNINSDRYEILPFEHNSKYSDYPAYLHKNRLYYITSLRNNKSGLSNKYTSDVFFKDEGEKTMVQTPKGELNSEFNEGSLVISRDGNTMYFTRNSFLNNRYAKKSKKDKKRIITLNIYVAELIDGEWKNIEPLSINNLEYSVAHPALSLDEKTLYFSSNMPGGKGLTDLYSVKIKDNGKLGKPVNLAELNTIGKEMFPFVDTQNGNLYFSSDRSTSLGGFDIYLARLGANQKYEDAFNLGAPINSSFDDFAYMINNSKKGYFSSNRIVEEEGKKEKEDRKDEIYNFFESRPYSFSIFLAINGVALDAETGKPVAAMKVSLYDKDGTLLETVLSDEKGNYVFKEKDIADIAYVKMEKEGYMSNEVSLDPEKLASKNSKLDLKPIPIIANQSATITITGKITDKNSTDSNEGLSNAKLTFLDINGNRIGTKKTNQNGVFSYEGISRKDIAFVRIEKDGYLTEERALNANKIKGETVDFNIALSTSKVSKKSGADIASILNTIYFDTGAHTIREDAKLELEKIVQVLNEYNDIEILIGSHTDSRSSSSFNQKLSQRRAKATYNYIILRGITPSRLSFKGYGESDLLNKCGNGIKCSEEEHQLNRRSSFTIRE